MQIGLVSDSESFIPTAHTLATLGFQVYVYFLKSPDSFVNQKVLEFAKQAHIPVTEEKNKEHDLYKWLNQGPFEVCFIIGYKYRIQIEKLTHCQTPLFNVHFGSLPSFKGPIPVFWQLKQGVDKITVSIHKLTKDFDEGPVVWMKETENLAHYNFGLVGQMLSQLCVEGIRYIIFCLMSKSSIPTIDRSNYKPTYQKRPQLNDVVIDWKKMEATEICNLIRACNPWNKGAITFFQGKEVKLMDAILVQDAKKNETGISAGTITNHKENIHIQCIENKTLNVNMLYFQDIYLPAYQCAYYGFKINTHFESIE